MEHHVTRLGAQPSSRSRRKLHAEAPYRARHGDAPARRLRRRTHVVIPGSTGRVRALQPAAAARDGLLLRVQLVER